MAHDQLYPEATPELAAQRTRLAPEPAAAFRAFSRTVFAEAHTLKENGGQE